MSRFTCSTWLTSTGGPLILMDSAKACLWTEIDGQPSDYDLACQTSDYAQTLITHGAQVVVLGDEPLPTTIATRDDVLLLVRWRWAESEADVQAALDNLDFGQVSYIERLSVEWAGTELVLFDAAYNAGSTEGLNVQLHSRNTEISTFVYEPTPDTALLIHAIKCE